mmetsp:Transcript_25610/g.84310  ORF Transcript_25610/g.84310 Transcript_25610/m.84310 type:complete len:205 (-) Transcript_25610:885-1499(-)
MFGFFYARATLGDDARSSWPAALPKTERSPRRRKCAAWTASRAAKKTTSAHQNELSVAPSIERATQSAAVVAEAEATPTSGRWPKSPLPMEMPSSGRTMVQRRSATKHAGQTPGRASMTPWVLVKRRGASVSVATASEPIPIPTPVARPTSVRARVRARSALRLESSACAATLSVSPMYEKNQKHWRATWCAAVAVVPRVTRTL